LRLLFFCIHIGLSLYSRTPIEWVLCFVYFVNDTCTFVIYMVYDILVLDVVYDMQVWYGYVLSEVPLKSKFVTSRTVFAIVCADMDFVCKQFHALIWITFYYLNKNIGCNRLH
jgi:hypothetical protein